MPYYTNQFTHACVFIFYMFFFWHLASLAVFFGILCPADRGEIHPIPDTLTVSILAIYGLLDTT